MTTVDGALVRKQAYGRPAHLLWALWRVTIWEARRTVMRPLTWVVAALLFAVFALVMDSQAHPGGPRGFGDGIISFQAVIPYGSAEQIYYLLPFDLIFPLALVIVFVATDGVARDWHRRTHELVMATSLPTWAYVWGRFLVVTALSLVFAVELLLAILFLITIKHATIGGANYPAAQLGPVLATWAALVLPTTLLAGGLSFALGTLLFRKTTLVKLGIVLAWFFWMGALPAIAQENPDVPQWLLQWDPTYVGLAKTGLYDIYDTAFEHSTLPLEQASHAISQTQLLGIFDRQVNELPDVGSWLPPHLVWALLAVGLVLLASRVFTRYQIAVR
jgi:ABC-type transport system involved in multi-copper enzyme maturation permease subunit